LPVSMDVLGRICKALDVNIGDIVYYVETIFQPIKQNNRRAQYMKKLCFGTFATILKICMAKRVTQKQLCGTMLLSIAPTYDIRSDDGTVSDLILGKKIFHLL